jgi:dGTPase
MDIADDIAYSTYDLEDAFKAGFISPIDMLIQDNAFYESISNEINNLLKANKDTKYRIEISALDIKDIISDLVKFLFELPNNLLKGLDNLKASDLTKEEYLFLGQQYSTKYNKLVVSNGYIRADFSSQLISSCVDRINLNLNKENPVFSKIELDTSTLIRIEVLKRIAFKTQILSPKLKAQEHRGKRIVKKIFDSLNPLDHKSVPALLPDDFKVIYRQKPGDKNHQFRTVCDYIACMTDQYAVEFYGRITSENPSSIFRPH